MMLQRGEIVMEKEKMRKAYNKYVMVESREQKFITCPHCWTDQRTDRDFCYGCGAVFFYLNETRNRNHA